jgi:glycosyltransferase involved in cell wall biosynthesis
LSIVDYLYKTKNIKVKINFIGIDAYHNMSTKIKRISENFTELIHISKRVPEDQLESIYSKSDLLWLTSFGEMKGWYPVKLFEYASKGIPILLFPSDKDVMAEFIKKTKTGYVFNDELKLQNWLECIYTSKSQIKLAINRDELKHYTREYQCEQLIDILDYQN